MEEIEGIFREENLLMFRIKSAASSWVRMIGGSRIWSIRFGGWSSSGRDWGEEEERTGEFKINEEKDGSVRFDLSGSDMKF